MRSWCIGLVSCWPIRRRSGSCGARSIASSWTSIKTLTPLKCGCSPPSPATVAMWSSSVIRTSRSMRSAVRKRGGSSISRICFAPRAATRLRYAPSASPVAAAGVPVEVAGDEIPLLAEQAVRPLLLALRAARAGNVTPDEAHALLTSPLGGLDSMGVRRLGRSLRQVERAELAGNGLPRLSGELVAAALRDPGLLAGSPPPQDQIGTGP